MVPDDTDIIITHGPSFRMMDKNKKGECLGCKDLFNRIFEIRPKVHICGHIHESYGETIRDGIRFINASIVNEDYAVVNKPISFDL